MELEGKIQKKKQLEKKQISQFLSTITSVLTNLAQWALGYPEGLTGGRGRVGPKRSRGINEEDPIVAIFYDYNK